MNDVNSKLYLIDLSVVLKDKELPIEQDLSGPADWVSVLDILVTQPLTPAATASDQRRGSGDAGRLEADWGSGYVDIHPGDRLKGPITKLRLNSSIALTYHYLLLFASRGMHSEPGRVWLNGRRRTSTLHLETAPVASSNYNVSLDVLGCKRTIAMIKATLQPVSVACEGGPEELGGTAELSGYSIASADFVLAKWNVIPIELPLRSVLVKVTTGNPAPGELLISVVGEV